MVSKDFDKKSTSTNVSGGVLLYVKICETVNETVS